MKCVQRLVLGVGCVLLWAPATLAQEATETPITAIDDSVVNRPRPEYDPIGISPGLLLNGGREPHGKGVAGVFDSFLLFPSMGVESHFTDNVFETTTRRLADMTTLFQPNIELRSDWDNHEFKLGTNGSLARNLHNFDANYNDYEIYTSGRLDISDNARSNLRLSHRESHQTNSILVNSTGQQFFNQGSKPVTYADDSVAVDGSYQRDIFLTKADFTARHLDYDSATQPSGTLLIESNFNLWEYDAHVRGGYEAFEGTVLYLEPGLSLRRYDHSPTDFPQLGAGTEDRNSNGGQLLAGLTYDATAVTYLDFGAGYIERRPRNPALPTARGLAIRGALTWNPTDLITVGASLNRDVIESTTLGVSGFFRTEAKLSLDYEYRYDMILQSSFDYAREDSIARAGFAERILDSHIEIAGLYLINEYAKARAGYRYENLVSSVANQSFKENQIFLWLDLFY